MQEGLNLNLVLNGATLLSVLGLFIKVYLSKQPQKIEQPIEVRQAACTTSKELCTERHSDIEKWKENIYARLIKCETDQAAYKATQDAVKERLNSMDTKLDELLSR